MLAVQGPIKPYQAMRAALTVLRTVQAFSGLCCRLTMGDRLQLCDGRRGLGRVVSAAGVSMNAAFTT